MAPKILSQLNRNAVPSNAGIVTLLAIWVVLLASYFFSQTTLYISLLLISGFTGAVAWISLCWAQINFRRELYRAGYSTKDLQYTTPGSPYTGIIAIVLMLFSLFFLYFSSEATYRIAFIIGSISVSLPFIIYKIIGLFRPDKMTTLTKHSKFSDLFPGKKPL